MSGQKYQFLFGPVPSRRLGQSLGLDIVPMKTCTQNCLYCQLGKDAPLTLDRKPYVPTGAVLDELRRWLDEGHQADYITLSGSGEPTLHSELGTLLDAVKSLTDIPTAVITNGTLLYLPDVRRDCAKADVVLPSLDAGDEATFLRLNNPHPDLNFQTFTDGLCQFRNEYPGRLWLEVFFCLGVNTDDASIHNIARLIEKIRPDKIQLNTAVRPTTHAEALPVPLDELERIARKLHPAAEIIADFSPHSHTSSRQVDENTILDMIRRHPCSITDICKGLSLNPDQARPLLDLLQNAGKISSDLRSGILFFKIS
jgi:wyosine [tRNA(Phe)-imidazoG37] synthetase (radical SAM superfamily)